MPKNTQMHMQWITVNGQSVPLVLPQYWDGKKWVISSEQNPLPVKLNFLPLDVNVVNRKLQEQLTEVDTTNGVLMFANNIEEIEIYNLDTVEGTFVVNNISISIPADTVFHAEIGGTPSKQVSVSGTKKYIVGRYA